MTGTPVRERDWNLDPTGNWQSLTRRTSGVIDVSQTRDHNEVNEILGLDASGGSSGGGSGDWADPAYDKNGNMTTMPRPGSLANGYTGVYDAWNRLSR